MLRSQEKQLRISEIRQRLNELAGKADLTAEERAEIDTLSTELSTVEAQYRAAVQAEDGEAREQRAAGDGEGAERARLQAEIRCGEYLAAAVEQRAVAGAEAEMNAAVGLAPVGLMPWAALVPRRPYLRDNARRGEQRADVAITAPATGNPINQAEILARVFARSATAFLRVAMPSVGVGQASFPVFATGTDADMAAKGAAVDAEAATFTANVLSPKRLSAAYLFSLEDTAVTRGLEAALREDLGGAMSNAMDKQVLTGDGAGANVPGFLGGHADGLVIPADVAGDVASYADYRELVTDQVDGVYANAAANVRLLVAPSTYKHADTIYRANETEETALEAVMRLAGGFQISGNMPATANNNDVVLSFRGMAPAAQAPVWEGIRLIRDEITGAAKGQIRITAIALWSFKVTRKDQYKAEKVKIA